LFLAVIQKSGIGIMKVCGSCNCGNVAFEVFTDLSDVYVCHCSLCRKSTGGSGIAVSVISSDHFKWLKGERFVSHWRKPNHDWETSFCTVCGSPLPGKNDDEHVYLPVSLLDSGDIELTVKHHLFVGSKAPWEEIGDDGVQHEAGYGMSNV